MDVSLTFKFNETSFFTHCIVFYVKMENLIAGFISKKCLLVFQTPE